MRLTHKKVLFSCFILLAGVPFTELQGQKRNLTVPDYAKWESLGYSRSISDDGNWFVYSISRNDDENELRLFHIKNQKETVLKFGTQAAFSSKGDWLGYFVTPSPKEKKNNSTKRNTFTLRRLADGVETTFEDVASFRFSGDGRFVALKKFSAKEATNRGVDLIIRELVSGKDFNFGNVSEYDWREKSSLLAMIIDAEGKAGNGVQLFDPDTGLLKILDSEDETYLGLVWRKKADDLAVFKVARDTSYQDSTHHILIWQDLSGKSPKSSIMKYSSIKEWPENTRVLNSSSLRWSKDGNSIFFETGDWNIKPDIQSKDEEDSLVDLTKEAPALQIWHSKDVKVIPEQEQLAKRKREKSRLSVWHISTKKFVALESDLVDNVLFQDDVGTLVGLDPTPYEQEGMFGRSNNDIYTVNVTTGAKRKILSKVNYMNRVSPDGKYIVYLKDDDYHIYDIPSGESKNLTDKIDVSFVNLDDDHPVDQKPPYRFINWDKSAKYFYVNSKYDIWQFNVEGSKARKITDGGSDAVIHRYLHLDEEEPYIDAKKPLFLSLFGEKNKKTGYGRVIAGKPVTNLIWKDASISRFTKARNANTYLFSEERFNDSPDYFVTDDYFRQPKQISHTNPFQKDFYWGKAELIEYKNTKGKSLQGTLYYPANYQPGQKYPMITYIYERLSNGIHRYRSPSQRDYYSPTVFTSNGYFVLYPDIVFDAGDPGISSVRTMEMAVESVVKMGLVDENKVGLIGHSWGGYQAGYAVTQTDIFAASVAGAGLTNLISMYGMVAWAFGGTPENFHFEVSQERMQVPPWEDVEGYIRNSPVFNVDKLNTPLLFEVGDNDKNVDWRQGIEYYNSARRAGKQFILLVYANEGHGLRSDNNRADYQARILKWFAHYLKDEPAEDWILQGIPYEEQQDRLRNWSK